MLAFRPILVPAALFLALGSAAGAREEAPRERDESPPRRVRGRVLDGAGWPLPGARVYALRRPAGGAGAVETRPILETSTDAGGRFALDALEPGSYQVDIEAPDHQAAHVGVHLPETPVPVVPLEVHLWPLTTAPVSVTSDRAAVRSLRSPVGSSAAESTASPATSSTGNATAGPAAIWAAGSAADSIVGSAEAVAPDVLAVEVTRALEAGQVREARALLDRVDGVRVADADLFYAVGEALLRAGETGDAVAVLEGALARDPDHVEARYRRALGLLGLGRREDARAEFERVLDLGTEGPLAEGARTALAELDRPRQAPR